MFPRATAGARHGTFKDCEARLAYVAELGFDVLYFPAHTPDRRHPAQGTQQRHHRESGRPGQPVGDRLARRRPQGHPPASWERPRTSAAWCAPRARSGIEIALDIAFQCSPDHPYVTEHPEWFRHRPDGSVQYAENPPKKYEDIYPFDFETADWRALWMELKSIFEHWIGEGVRIFRVDNPHTKPFAMWEWMIGEISSAHPDVIFLSEAFTRPKIMHRLAKIGFTQSYTYFTWRNTKTELTEYFTELAQSPVARAFPAQRVAKHAGHTPRYAPARRAARLHRAARARGDAGGELRHLRPGVRADGARAARAGQRGIPQLREIRDPQLDTRPPREPARPHRAREPHPSREPGTARGLAPRLPRDRQRPAHLLFEVDAGPLQRHPDSRQSRPALPAIGVGRSRLAGARPRRRRVLRGSRSARRTRASPGADPATTSSSIPAGSPHISCASSRAGHEPASSGEGAVHGGCAGGRAGARRGPALVQGRHHLPASRQGVLRQQRRRHRRLSGPHREARLHQGPGRQHDLAPALLSLAAARRRLRHRRLSRHPSRLRHPRRLPALRARGAPARPQDRDRARHQPHLRRASLVPGGAAGAARLAQARLLRVERHRPEMAGDADHLHRHREVQLDLGPGGEGLLLAPLLLAPARSQLRQPPRRADRDHASCATGSTWAWTGCGSTPSPTCASATARTTRTCPRRTPC